MTNLFTTTSDPQPVQKGSFDEIWAEYKAERDALLRKLYPDDEDLFEELNDK